MKLRATRWRGWFRNAASADEATLGRKPTDEEEAKWHAASDGERDALTALCRYPARTVADQVAKGRYLRKFHSWVRRTDDRADRRPAAVYELRQKGGAVMNAVFNSLATDPKHKKETYGEKWLRLYADDVALFAKCSLKDLDEFTTLSKWRAMP